MTAMTDPIPSAGETTIIGLPAITVPVTSTGDRPLTKEDLNTIMRLADGTALLISTRGAVSGSRYLLDEDEITVGRDRTTIAPCDGLRVRGGEQLPLHRVRHVQMQPHCWFCLAVHCLLLHAIKQSPMSFHSEPIGD